MLLASICCHFSFSLLLSLQTHSSFFTSFFPHSSLIPLRPSLCCFYLVPVSTTAQCMNVLSECPQYFCVSLEAQVSVHSVVNELLLQAGGLCKCLCSGKPGQFVQWQQLPVKQTRWQWQAVQYICIWNGSCVPFQWNQPLNTLILSHFLQQSEQVHTNTHRQQLFFHSTDIKMTNKVFWSHFFFTIILLFKLNVGEIISRQSSRLSYPTVSVGVHLPEDLLRPLLRRRLVLGHLHHRGHHLIYCLWRDTIEVVWSVIEFIVLWH